MSGWNARAGPFEAPASVTYLTQVEVVHGHRPASQRDLWLQVSARWTLRFPRYSVATVHIAPPAIAQWRTTEQYGALNASFTPSRAGYTEYSHSITGVLSRFTEATAASKIAFAEQAQELSKQATILASINHFQVLIGVGCVGAALMWCQKLHR